MREEEQGCQSAEAIGVLQEAMCAKEKEIQNFFLLKEIVKVFSNIFKEGMKISLGGSKRVWMKKIE